MRRGTGRWQDRGFIGHRLTQAEEITLSRF